MGGGRQGGRGGRHSCPPSPATEGGQLAAHGAAGRATSSPRTSPCPPPPVLHYSNPPEGCKLREGGREGAAAAGSTCAAAARAARWPLAQRRCAPAAGHGVAVGALQPAHQQELAVRRGADLRVHPGGADLRVQVARVVGWVGGKGGGVTGQAAPPRCRAGAAGRVQAVAVGLSASGRAGGRHRAAPRRPRRWAGAPTPAGWCSSSRRGRSRARPAAQAAGGRQRWLKSQAVPEPTCSGRGSWLRRQCQLRPLLAACGDCWRPARQNAGAAPCTLHPVLQGAAHTLSRSVKVLFCAVLPPLLSCMRGPGGTGGRCGGAPALRGTTLASNVSLSSQA
jgi:hypothetical protein